MSGDYRGGGAVGQRADETHPRLAGVPTRGSRHPLPAGRGVLRAAKEGWVQTAMVYTAA